MKYWLFEQGEEHEAEGELGDYRKDRNNSIQDIQIKECKMRQGRAWEQLLRNQSS